MKKIISIFVVFILSIGLIACGNGKHTHSFNEWSITTNATCTQEGVQSRRCVSCGFVEQSSLAKIGHSEVIDSEVMATCTTDGMTAGSHCGVCGTVIIAQNTINASCAFVDGVCTQCGKFDESFCYPIYELLLEEMITFENTTKSDEIIKGYLDKLPLGYKNTDLIREQFIFIKAQFDVFRDGNYRHLIKLLDSTHEDAFVYYERIQDAYCSLLEKQNDSAYSLWNIKKCAEMWLFDDTINSLTLGCMLGYWEDEDGNFMNVVESNTNSISIGTSLPSNRNANNSYYYYCRGNVIGYVNIDDTSDEFDSYRIVSITANSLKLYSFSDEKTYTLYK